MEIPLDWGMPYHYRKILALNHIGLSIRKMPSSMQEITLVDFAKGVADTKG